MIKKIYKTMGIPLVLLLIGTLLGALLILLAYGVGWLLRLFLPFSAFEATLLVLIAYALLGSFIFNILRPPLPLIPINEEVDDWDDEELEEEEGDEPVVVYLPKKKNPSSFSKDEIPVVGADARCPCGSGRKYKNCHGRKTVAR